MHIFMCNHCGANFDAETVDSAIQGNKSTITCPYCGQINAFNANFQKHIDKGYSELGYARFNGADDEFSLALSEQNPTHDAYLGAALSQFRIQTVFEDNNPKKFPRLVFHSASNSYFSESSHYVNARNAIQKLHYNVAENELFKLNQYAEIIDSFKSYYDQFESQGISYDVFVAYEDDGKDFRANYEIAQKVRNLISDNTGSIFFPEIDDYKNSTQYEAAILYALLHSKSMLVVADSDINFRLRTMFTRFYNVPGNKDKLCFVKFKDTESVSLPDNSVARLGKNLFDYYGDASEYKNFICDILGIVSFRGTPSDIPQPANPVAEPTSTTVLRENLATGIYSIIDSTHYAFGRYPQRQETSKDVLEVFSNMGLPTASNSNGWSVMFCDSDNKPFTWYLDKDINGKTYRAVYFVNYRGQFLLNPNSISNSGQTRNGYYTSNLYCFEFQPIVWKVLRKYQHMVELITDIALDAQQFSSTGIDNSWEGSHLRAWLNGDFANVAFDSDEYDSLGRVDGSDERVYILNQVADKQAIARGTRAIAGSDYFKCMGGSRIGNTIDSYWIVSDDDMYCSEAAVVCPQDSNSIDYQSSDCTSVAVLPKIILKL